MQDLLFNFKYFMSRPFQIQLFAKWSVVYNKGPGHKFIAPGVAERVFNQNMNTPSLMFQYFKLFLDFLYYKLTRQN